jgi:hypothetical protein
LLIANVPRGLVRLGYPIVHHRQPQEQRFSVPAIEIPSLRKLQFENTVVVANDIIIIDHFAQADHGIHDIFAFRRASGLTRSALMVNQNDCPSSPTMLQKPILNRGPGFRFVFDPGANERRYRIENDYIGIAAVYYAVEFLSTVRIGEVGHYLPAHMESVTTENVEHAVRRWEKFLQPFLQKGPW